MRWRLIVDTKVSRETADGTQFIPAFLSSVNVELFNDEDDDLEEQVDVAIDMVNRRLTDFQGQGSGWRLHGIDRVAIQCSKHSPITGSSYIPNPKFIESRKAIVNVKNVNDDLCFLYSVLAHIHPIDRNPNQIFHYKPFLHELDYSGLTFPLKIRQIRKFEDQNSHISINVLYHDPETNVIMPLRVTKHRNREHHVNLFLLYDDGAKEDDVENPRLMQRPRHLRKKQQLSQSIIILWFAASPHCFGRIQRKTEPCTCAHTASIYFFRTKRNMKLIWSTARSTNLKSSSCLIQMMWRKTPSHSGTYSNHSPSSSACTWISNASWVNRMGRGRMFNRYTKYQVFVCFVYPQSRRWTTVNHTSTAARTRWRSFIGICSKSTRKLTSTCGPTCLWNASHPKSSNDMMKP